MQQTQPAAIDALWSLANGSELTDTELSALRAYDSAPRDAGFALQLGVLDRWRAQGESVGGWKIAWTSRGARDRGGVNFRPFGFILASRIFPSGKALRVDSIRAGALEPEICLTLGQRLSGPDVTRDEARAAVAAVRPAFEVASRRMPSGLSIAANIGDSMKNWGLIIGPGSDPSTIDQPLAVVLRHDGELIGSGDSGPATVDDPFLSLARVCRELDAQGLALESGHHVITGSILPNFRLVPGVITATFGALGDVSVEGL